LRNQVQITYAQRHADAGVPVDVLAALMDHRSLDTTRAYYTNPRELHQTGEKSQVA
jgi:integrase